MPARSKSSTRSGESRSSVLSSELLRIFGSDADPITAVEARARLFYPHTPTIIWEGDASTFAFTYVGGDAEKMLGYTSDEWTSDPGFWTAQVVHPEDRTDAVAFCALATGRKTDHVFEYRAIARNQTTIWLRDYVRVLVGARGIPVRLRGVMFDVSEEKWAERAVGRADGVSDVESRPLRLPSMEELEAAG